MDANDAPFRDFPRERAIIEALGGDLADEYLERYLLRKLGRIAGIEEPSARSVRAKLESPETVLRLLLEYYVFARRGRDRDALGSAAREALDSLLSTQSFPELMENGDSTQLWEAFAEACERNGQRPHEQQDRGPVQGGLELAQEVYQLTGGGSIAAWIQLAVQKSGALEAVFERIVDIRGLGPKNTSNFLRDMVFFLGLEDALHPKERIFIQTIDKWVRQIAPHIIPEELYRTQDFVLAGKINKYTRLAGVSPIRFSMGASYFGSRVVGSPDRLDEKLEELVDQPGASKIR